MPVNDSYPGVYIEEIPGSVRTIAGVGTSIAAFVGWAARGPTLRAQRILCFSDFVRHFGGLDRRSLLGYAVRHFFANGGRDAYVIRLAADNAAAGSVTIDSCLGVTAGSPGAWSAEYRIETQVRSDDPTRFRLAVFHQPSGQPPVTVECFENLSILEADPRFVKRVVNAESACVQVELIGTPSAPPADAAATVLAGGADGDVLDPGTAAFEGKLDPLRKNGGLYLLDQVERFNLLCVPGETTATVVVALQRYCHDRRAFLIVDGPGDAILTAMRSGPDASLTGSDAPNSAFYFPWIKAPDPLDHDRIRAFPPCGFVAGIYARTDATRGVWKAPAGTEANMTGAAGTVLALTDADNGTLNSRGINCIRTLPAYGTVVWGSRTLHGADERGSEWKYVPVRRLALFIEESLCQGTRWVVFEPNDEPLWAQIRRIVGAFMHDLFRQGAFQGNSPRDAYFVRCDKETTTRSDIELGVVNIVVGFAPLKPAEFVVIKIQQAAEPLQARGDPGARFGAESNRLDPYENFKFRVRWEGRHVAGVSKVSALERGNEMLETRERHVQSSPRRSPGRTRYEPITLERGITLDPEFVRWANQGGAPGSGPGAEASFGAARKDIILEIYDEAGQRAMAYKIHRCWVSEIQAPATLDATAGAVAIQHIKLENEGWERD